MIRRQRLDQLGVLQRRGPDDHPRHAQLEPALRALARADAAAELHLAGEALQDALDRVGVDRLAREGSVEVDHVQPARPCFGKARGLFARIVAVDGRAVHIAFGEADHVTGFQVDGGEDDHKLAP